MERALTAPTQQLVPTIWTALDALVQELVGWLSAHRPNRDLLTARTREMVAGQIVSLIGVRPRLLPAGVRRQLAAAGLDEQIVLRVLGQMNGLADWPRAWAAEGDALAAGAQWAGAFVCYYLAQRPLLERTEQKEALYRKAVEAYALAPHTPPVERLMLDADGRTIAALVQGPRHHDATTGAPPLVLLAPGATSTKEELHLWSQGLVARGFATARVDTPGYGESGGIVDADAFENLERVRDELVGRGLADPRRVILLGVSFGGFLALHAAALAPHRYAGCITVSAPISPHRYQPRMPSRQLVALRRMTGSSDDVELRRRMMAVDIAVRADRLVHVPLLAVHGTRDHQVPVRELERLEDMLTEDRPADLTCVRLKGAAHGCLTEIDTIIGIALEWLDRHGIRGR